MPVAKFQVQKKQFANSETARDANGRQEPGVVGYIDADPVNSAGRTIVRFPDGCGPKAVQISSTITRLFPLASY